MTKRISIKPFFRWHIAQIEFNIFQLNKTASTKIIFSPSNSIKVECKIWLENVARSFNPLSHSANDKKLIFPRRFFRFSFLHRVAFYVHTLTIETTTIRRNVIAIRRIRAATEKKSITFKFRSVNVERMRQLLNRIGEKDRKKEKHWWDLWDWTNSRYSMRLTRHFEMPFHLAHRYVMS